MRRFAATSIGAANIGALMCYVEGSQSYASLGVRVQRRIAAGVKAG